MTKAALFFLAGFICFSLASAQGVYKWTDEKGKIHYGDIPTTNKVKKVDTRPPMKGTVKPTPKCPNAKD